MNSNNSVPNNETGKQPTNYETIILKNFLNIALNKFSSSSEENLGRLEREYGSKSKSNNDFKAEQNIINVLNISGLRWGIGASVASFFILRRLPPYLLKRFQRKQASISSQREATNSRNNPFMNPGGQQKQQSSHEIPRSSDEKIELPLRKGWIRYSLGLFIDVNLALWTGASVTAYMTNVKAFLFELEKLPLVEGRSAVSQELCPDFTAAYKTIRDKYEYDWDKPESSHDAIRSIQNFVRNCQRRKAHEMSIRAQEGLAPHFPVVIPSPGVPISTPISEDEDEYEENYGSKIYEYNNSSGGGEGNDLFDGQGRARVAGNSRPHDNINDDQDKNEIDDKIFEEEWNVLNDDKPNEDDELKPEKNDQSTKRFRWFS